MTSVRAGFFVVVDYHGDLSLAFLTPQIFVFNFVLDVLFLFGFVVFLDPGKPLLANTLLDLLSESKDKVSKVDKKDQSDGPDDILTKTQFLTYSVKLFAFILFLLDQSGLKLH